MEENPTNDDIEVKEEFDLIVFSAEPEGIAAAIQAARSNLKVLLVLIRISYKMKCRHALQWSSGKARG